jgi:hypothetical protein
MFASREKVIAVLTELGARLDARGIHGDIYIVGGTAMLLGYNRLAVTNDIDAIYTPSEVIDEISAQMYSENPRLGRDWLNSKVLPLLPRIADSGAWEVLSVPGLSVSVASAEFLLAMKARATRGRRDLDDVGVLTEILGFTQVDHVFQTCENVWGFDALQPDIKELLSEYLQERGLT